MKFILKEFVRAFIIGLLVFVVLGIIQYLNSGSFNGNGTFVENLIYNQIYSVVLYGANALLVYYLISKYKNEVFKIKHLSKGIFGGILITLISIFLLRLTNDVYVYGESLETFVSGETPRYYYSSFIISMVIILTFYSVFYYRHKQETKEKNRRLSPERLQPNLMH